ncbi:hypothetical protein XENORESO_015747 [Xenotaenia resolanae]|uniref:Uncharacterized protein n=1 Tax=Xenotaenia resolanae TaxID=208358 RepID=A0ABV0WU71_9TELE
MPVTSTKSPSTKKGVEQATAENVIAMLRLATQEQGTYFRRSIDDLKSSVTFSLPTYKTFKRTLQTKVNQVSKAVEKIKSLENKVLELARYTERKSELDLYK